MLKTERFHTLVSGDSGSSAANENEGARKAQKQV